MGGARAGGHTTDFAGCVRLFAGQSGIVVGAVYGLCGVKKERVCGDEGPGLVP